MADSSKQIAREGASRRRLRRQRQSAAKKGVGRPTSEINVTPFVDVVLVLLIIFMVVTPMLQRGVDVLLPITDHHAAQRDTGKQLIISVREKGQLFFGRDAVNDAQLSVRLRERLSQQPQPPVFLKGDRRLKFKTVRRIMEICQRAGARGVALATEGRKGGS